MLPPHPTLRFSDLAFRRARSLKTFNAPHDLHLTYNARGAFYQLLKSFPVGRGQTVLLPAFHCTALVEPVARAGFKAEFYRVRPDFSVDFNDVSSKMSADVAAVVAVHYFGFPTDLQPFRDLAVRHHSFLVEDCAHSFLSRQSGICVGHGGDFSLFSYYKFAPSLAGGGLGINLPGVHAHFSKRNLPFRERIVLAKRQFERILENSPSNPVSKMLLALERKRVSQKIPSSVNGAPSQFVDDPYLFSEKLALAGMPGLCQHILESGNWGKMVADRKRNYQLFSSLIEETSLIRRPFPDLPDTVCPWAFPVLIENRISREQGIRASGVPLFTFGEVLHPLLASSEDDARKDAEYLSQRLMLLPVHSQLQERDVREFANIVNRSLRTPVVEESNLARSESTQHNAIAGIHQGKNS